MYGAEIEKHYILYGVLMFLLGVIVTIYLLCYRYSNNFNTTIQNIKEQQSVINNEIGNASNGIGNASNSVKRVSDTIDGVQEKLIQSERIANDNAGRISNITKIARECKSIAEENRAILDEIGNANK